MNLSKQNSELLKHYGFTSESIVAQCIPFSARFIFIPLFTTAMTNDVHILGQERFPPASHNANLFFFTQESIMKASESDVIIEKILNSFSSIRLEIKSFASLITLTTNHVTVNQLASMQMEIKRKLE